MIRIMTKYPDGKWVTSTNTSYSKSYDMEYAKALVRWYRFLLDNGIILAFKVEIQTTVKNRQFIKVIGYGGM